MKKAAKKKVSKKTTKKVKKMLTQKAIEKAISDAIESHNKEAEAHNEKARANNYSLSYRDPKYMLQMDEINENDPNSLFDENDVDFGDFEFRNVDSFGGEGQGDHCHEVYLVTQKSTGETAHIKFDGYYNSNDGSSYDDGFYMVEQYEKVVKDWREV